MGTTENNRIEVLPLTTQVLAMLFSATAFILSAAAVNGCDFFKVSASLDMFEVSGGLFKCECVHILLKLNR